MAGVPSVELAGSYRKTLKKTLAAEPASGDEIASLTVRTRPRTPMSVLRTTIDTIYAQPLSERVYLTRTELAERHGALPEDLDAIEQFAHRQNLVVSRRSAAERSIVLTGRLSDLLRAFPADVQTCHMASGRYRVRQGPVMVPAALAQAITGIFGYDTRPKQRARRKSRVDMRASADIGTGVPAAAYAARYNFPTVHQGRKLDGSGCCIALIELGGGFRSDDLQTYFTEIGAPLPNVAAVSVDGIVNAPTIVGSSDGEVMLDIEAAGSVAPGASFVVYFSSNQGRGFLDAVSAAVHDSERNPDVVSISWGGPEASIDGQTVQAFSDLFTAAASMGVTICAASGDHGVADQEATAWDNLIHVDHPASDPMVLACGGTQIDPTTGQDVVWNDGTPFDFSAQDGGGWASGGGISTVFPVPAYQKTLALPASLDGTGKAGRGVPDIAMSATGYRTRADGTEFASRGTSAVVPVMAGLVALISQAKGRHVGYLNPLLYSTPGLFKDVVSGTNGIANTVVGYQAGAGWNACTGLGTPNGAAILDALEAPVS